MGRVSKETRENRENMLVEAFLTCPSVAKAAEKTGIGKTAIYEYMKSDSFQKKLAEARQQAVEDVIGYMQGNLSECAEVLMQIVRDTEAAPQIRINAANAMFMNIKGLAGDSGLSGGMVVKINDSI